MQWLAIRFRNGEMKCQSRQYREELLDNLRRESKPVLSRVERVFEDEQEAKNYCICINEVNNLIRQILNK